MSNIVAVFSKSARKPFKGASLDAAIGAILPPVRFPMDGDKITANQVSITDDMFRSSVGADLTPVSFANSTAYAVARFAYGAKLDVLLKGCTPALAHGMAAACGNVKFGGGLTVGDLRGSIAVGFTALLALPTAKPKEEAPVVVAPVVVAPVVVAPTLDYIPHADLNIFPFLSPKCADISDVSNYLSLPFDERLAMARRETKTIQAQRIAEFEANRPFFQHSFDVVVENDKEKALEILADLAEKLGYRLAKIPAKKAVKIAA